MSKTKIICTLGPATEETSVLLKMIRAGMDVVRLNFSHGDLRGHHSRIQQIRQLNKRYGLQVKILGDLEGYRLRIGDLAGGKPVEVKKGQRIRLTPKEFSGNLSAIPFDYTGPLNLLKKGQHIFIDDGNIVLIIESRQKNAIQAKALIGGLIKEHKGINMPDVRLPFRGLTDRDKKNIEFCLENRVDFIAQSFVRNKVDICDLRKYLAGRSGNIKIIAKIENREGIKNIDQIIKVSDGIMVARGDMGVSIPIYEVPMVQKNIIHKCRRAHKIVITATQMLESMTEHHRPTRAEVSDVANAILDGSAYVMLSAETAVGKYPVETVDMMDQIIRFTESHRR